MRNAVVEEHHWLAMAIARRFERSSEPLDDLVQVGLLGLVKAAERFDPDHGASFVSFASVTVRGEIRRHFRDHGWTMRVPRRLQELRYDVRRTADRLGQANGRSPTPAEVAAELGVRADDVVDALCADENYRPLSLEERTGDGPSIGDRAGGWDDRFDVVEADDAFDRLADRCPPRLRLILRLRYLDGLRQIDIAERLGISQVHVSRLLASAYRMLQDDGEDGTTDPSDGPTTSQRLEATG